MNQHNPRFILTPKLSSLAVTLDDLLRHKISGAALPECYGDETGSLTWAHFVRKSRPDVQYTFQSEVSAIAKNAGAIAALIAQDPDIDTSNLILIEKGGGSREARIAKPFQLVEAFQEAGMRVALYSGWEKSAEYRQQGLALAAERIPEADASELDVDFNHDDPDIATANTPDVERPRIVMELGSSRGNIATSETSGQSFEDQTYEELQRRFAHDRKNCREGGIVIVGSDANNLPSARHAYTHPVHAKFAENIIQRGSREGALSAEFNPQLFYYDPIHDQSLHVVRHTLIAAANQNFGIMSANGRFKSASVREDGHFVLSHSIKWPQGKMIAAAESQGFKCLGVFWGDDHRVPIYVFKAVRQSPAVHLRVA